MKVAQNTDGEEVTAGPSAPRKAVCPCCGGTLHLRSRRTMNNGKPTYYWRHRSNRDVDCSARNRPIS